MNMMLLFDANWWKVLTLSASFADGLWNNVMKRELNWIVSYQTDSSYRETKSVVFFFIIYLFIVIIGKGFYERHLQIVVQLLGMMEIVGWLFWIF